MTLIEVRQAHKTYRHHGHDVLAVRGVDLTIEPGETLALVGESGCGKSTLGRLLAGTSRATSGDVLLDGRDLYAQCASDRTARRRVQMVFQHPLQSLNPRFSVEKIIARAAQVAAGLVAAGGHQRLHETMGLVGLDAEYLRRRPTDTPAGNRQRVALARALMEPPQLIVLDEPTSSLDQSVRRRTVALLRQVQERTGVAYLFITHDLATVPQIAHRVAVMYLGRIVEEATPERLFAQPAHPYTRALIAAAPTMTVGRREWEVIRGRHPARRTYPADVPSEIAARWRSRGAPRRLHCSRRSCPATGSSATELSETPSLIPQTGGHLLIEGRCCPRRFVGPCGTATPQAGRPAPGGPLPGRVDPLRGGGEQAGLPDLLVRRRRFFRDPCPVSPTPPKPAPPWALVSASRIPSPRYRPHSAGVRDRQ